LKTEVHVIISDRNAEKQAVDVEFMKCSDDKQFKLDDQLMPNYSSSPLPDKQDRC